MTKYGDLLKDPRWQKKRLTILSRDKWTCHLCSRTDRTLHVHHREYTFGVMPWDYDDSNFITLCEPCHEFEETVKREEPSTYAFAKFAGLLATELHETMCAVAFLKINNPEEYQIIRTILDKACLAENKDKFYEFIMSGYKS